MKTRAPFTLRAWRLIRLTAHALRGWLQSLRIAHGKDPRRDDTVREWSQRLLHVMGVRVTAHDAPDDLPRGAVLVANHGSWLDIFLIYTRAPGHFIAKTEIRGWPLIGGMIDRVGTFFIERGSPRHARLINAQIAHMLRAGRIICIFPEGAVNEGHEMLPFHSALFEPAIEAEAQVIPVALRYVGADGKTSMVANYAGSMTLLQSVWRIVSHRGLHAELHFLPPVPTTNAHRRELCRQTQNAIAEKLGLSVRDRRSGTRAGPQDE
jgi:1-acyl-sn-glycerol-3-phosphate acyltransferase